jgi:serine/threonine-protein kinase
MNKDTERDNNEKGFSLTEVLVVMTIITIVALIAIPLFNNNRNKAFKQVALSDGQSIALETADLLKDYSNLGTGATFTIIPGSGVTKTLQINLGTGYSPSTLGNTVKGTIAVTNNTVVNGTLQTNGTSWCITSTNNNQSIVYTDQGLQPTLATCPSLPAGTGVHIAYGSPTTNLLSYNIANGVTAFTPTTGVTQGKVAGNNGLTDAWQATFPSSGNSNVSTSIPVTPGTTYTASIWLKDTTTHTIHLSVECTGDGTYLCDPTSGGYEVVTVTPSWQLFTNTFTVPVGKTTASFEIYSFNGDSTTSQDITYWHPQIELGGVSTEWFSPYVPVPTPSPSFSAPSNGVAPSAPTVNSAIVTSTNSVTVSWNTPSYPGTAAITNYTVTSNTGGYTCSTSVPVTTCAITGLPTGSYTFTVTAINAEGTSVSSSPTNSVNPAVDAVPTSPLSPTVVVGPTISETISWAAPSSVGSGPATTYTVTSNTGGYTCTAVAPATSCVISGMLAGSYTFAVVATNPSQTVTASPASSSASSVTVSWTAPVNQGVTPITTYTVTSNTGGYTCTAVAPATSCVISGMTGGTHTFTVTTNNSPLSLDPTVITTSSVVVSWTAPTSPGISPITTYTVSSNTSGYTCTAVAPATTCTVSGIGSGIYTFTVVASNILGSGSSSTATTPIRPTPITIFYPNTIFNTGQVSQVLTPVTTGTVGSTTFAYTGSLPTGVSFNPATGAITGPAIWTKETPSNVYAGYDHSCAIMSTGIVKCWGGNDKGQLGNNSTVSSSLPVTVVGLSNVIALSLGQQYSCALTASYQLYCWGYNNHGQLGNNSITDSLVPVLIAANVTSVATSPFSSTTCAIISNSDDCWGSNTNGTIGDGTTNERHTPTAVLNSSMSDIVTQISVGYLFACAVTATHGGYCWGNDNVGQLGNGTTAVQYLSPQQISGLTSSLTTSVKAGYDHSCALVSNKVKCWGNNSLGELGTVSSSNASSPADVDTSVMSSNIIDFDSGNTHTCATTATDTFCWGDGSYGQNGDGSVVKHTTPWKVPGIKANAHGLTSGNFYHCVGIGASAKCWGNDSSSQLGDLGGNLYAVTLVANNNLNNYPGFPWTTTVTVTDSGTISNSASTLNTFIAGYLNGGDTITFIGNGTPGYVDGTGTAAQVNGPKDLALDSLGNIYVTDYFDNMVRKITPAGVVSSYTGDIHPGFHNGNEPSTQFRGPSGLGFDGADNLFIADSNNNVIREVLSKDISSLTFAGSGSVGSADGTGTAASFNNPQGLAVDAADNIYVADTGNNKIRKITSLGVVTTFAGSGSAGSADGTGVAASFNAPQGVAIDNLGNVYIADTGNNKIRKITPAGVVTTIAGSGVAGYFDANGTSAQFNAPIGIAVDAISNVYVSETSNIIRKISPYGVVTTLAGAAPSGYIDAKGKNARFWGPQGLVIGTDGNLYIADFGNALVRKLH